MFYPVLDMTQATGLVRTAQMPLGAEMFFPRTWRSG